MACRPGLANRSKVYFAAGCCNADAVFGRRPGRPPAQCETLGCCIGVRMRPWCCARSFRSFTTGQRRWSQDSRSAGTVGARCSLLAPLTPPPTPLASVDLLCSLSSHLLLLALVSICRGAIERTRGILQLLLALFCSALQLAPQLAPHLAKGMLIMSCHGMGSACISPDRCCHRLATRLRPTRKVTAKLSKTTT